MKRGCRTCRPRRFEREDGIEFFRPMYISGDPAHVVDGGQWRLYRLSLPQS